MPTVSTQQPTQHPTQPQAAQQPTAPPTLGPVAPVNTDRLRDRPLPLTAVRLAPTGHLGRWQTLNAESTIPHSIRMLEESKTLNNLRRVIGQGTGDYTGYQFADSDVYKLIEAIGWEIGRSGTTDFDAFLDETFALLTAVQDDDGYLNSHFQGTGGAGEPRERFSDLRWGHELYCFGHLIQGAIALKRGAGRDDFLALARRAADLLVRRSAENGPDIDGHPEAETALIELYRLTGDASYLDLAEAMIEGRGRGVLGPDRLGPHYFQDHEPVRESVEATGHAVRQLYLNAGVTDLFTERGDDSLLAAQHGQWDTAHHEKMYITGAMGSRHFDESFGDSYELPPDRAYAETCASIADLQWSWRLLLLERDARYADAMERALYNSIQSSLSADGAAFYYSNPLHLRAGHREEENAPSRRTPWYHCACCPPNISRLVASLASYVASASEDELAIHLFTAADVDLPAHLGAGTLRIDADYPRSGEVTFALDGELADGARLALRIPAWATTWSLEVDGVTQHGAADQVGADGYVALTPRRTAVLTLDMPTELVAAHPRVDAVRGCVAISRGPVVYCVEQADHDPAVSVEDLRVPAEAVFALGEASLGGLPTLRTAARALPASAADGRSLYTVGGRPVSGGPAGAAPPAPAPSAEGLRDVELTAIPYADWGNRAAGPMRVWVPLA